MRGKGERGYLGEFQGLLGVFPTRGSNNVNKHFSAGKRMRDHLLPYYAIRFCNIFDDEKTRAHQCTGSLACNIIAI